MAANLKVLSTLQAQLGGFAKAQNNILAKYGSGAQSRFLELDEPAIAGRKLDAHVLEAGEGDPVLLIHGGGSIAVGTWPHESTVSICVISATVD